MEGTQQEAVPNRVTPPTPQRCVNEQGFSLHAEVRLAVNQRQKLEHLCRYITRPAIANASQIQGRIAVSS